MYIVVVKVKVESNYWIVVGYICVK